MKAIITDIEGTTTDIKFVHNVLFPYAKENLENFVINNNENIEVKTQIDDVLENYLEKNANLNDVIKILIHWIETDQKISPLKNLQGLMWERGYDAKDFTGHVYQDAFEKLNEWKESGVELFVYSSGSVYAQKLLFSHSDFGDMTPLFSNYFDTKVGGKKESSSYGKILSEIGFKPNEVLFLSDIEAELDAAKELGINTIHLNRDNLVEKSKHKIVKSFNEIGGLK